MQVAPAETAQLVTLSGDETPSVKRERVIDFADGAITLASALLLDARLARRRQDRQLPSARRRTYLHLLMLDVAMTERLGGLA
jgi:hypothetical protein